MKETDLTEIGNQVTKRKRPDLAEQFGFQVNAGDNTKYINHTLEVSSLCKIDINDNEAVDRRMKEYFSICAKNDMKPSMAGLALALGIDRRRLWEIREERKGKNPEVSDTLKRGQTMLDAMMVDYMQNGKINPVSGIFIMKNCFGYVDKQEVVVTPNNPLGDTKDPKEIEERYIDSVVEE